MACYHTGFLVVFVVFVLGLCSSCDNEVLNETPLSVSSTFMTGFVKTGMCSALVTITLAQLISQIVASRCNIDYLNYRSHYYAIVGCSLPCGMASVRVAVTLCCGSFSSIRHD
jgi:hypothetical protein